MVSSEALKKLQEQVAAWPITQRFVVQQLIEDYSDIRKDLLAYEDTGLTPELVRETAELAIWVHDNGIEKIKEWIKADKDGRLVVLPVKPVLTPILSSMLYIIEDGDIYEDALYEAIVGMSENGEMNVVYTTLSDQITFEQADIGKTVFLTHEKAEKALEAIKDE